MFKFDIHHTLNQSDCFDENVSSYYDFVRDGVKLGFITFINLNYVAGKNKNIKK